MKIVAIYPGRFQPAGKHHLETYKWAASKFNDAYIATSDKVEAKSPFTFSEKLEILKASGVPSGKIVKSSNPYVAKEITEKLNPKDTAIVFIVGSKDMDRFNFNPKKDGSKGYFQPYESNKNKLETFDKHGYIILAPHISIKVPGYGEMSGSAIRGVLGANGLSDNERKELFKAIYGFYNDKVYNIIKKKLVKENIEIFSKDWWKQNIADILSEHKKNVSDRQSKNSNTNTSFIDDILSELIGVSSKQKTPIFEGGAAGHMMHPFDNNNLTFGEFKNIIRMGLSGKLNVEKTVSEKTDGQNLMVSWKDGKLVAARNKGDLKNPIDYNAIAAKFAGRGNIEKAFTYAMQDLNRAISSLSDKTKEEYFDNGKNFMNLEIIFPATANVINYDVSVIQFHGVLKYDSNGNVIGDIPNAAKKLAEIIKSINKNVGDHFTIIPPVELTLIKPKDFSEKQAYFLTKIKTLQSRFNLKDSDSIAVYHEEWWKDYINKQAEVYKYNIPNLVLMNLVKRWAFFDKSYSIAQMKKDIDNDQFLNWAISFDKNDHTKQVKTNMFPFETLFLEFGAEVLYNAKGFLAANPDKAVQDIRKSLDATIKQVRNSNDLKLIGKLEAELNRIQAIGGMNKLVPAEGLVYQYKGQLYKLSGLFAPLNQILGAIKYAR